MFRIFQRLRWVYLSVFGVQVIPMSAIIVWREQETGGHANSFDLLIASALKIDDICYLSLITSVIIVDIGRYLLGILIEAPQDRAYERGLSQGIEQGASRRKGNAGSITIRACGTIIVASKMRSTRVNPSTSRRPNRLRPSFRCITTHTAPVWHSPAGFCFALPLGLAHSAAL